MAKNMSNIHKKLDRIMQKLGALDEIKNEQREMRLQTRYLAQMVNVSMQLLQETRHTTERMATGLTDIAAMLQRSNEIQADIAVMAQEARRAAQESNERIAELLAGTRKH
jgi:hypothetical protein